MIMVIRMKRRMMGERKAGICSGRKAFMFTLGFVLVALAILSFTKFVFKESDDEKTLFQQYVVMNRLDDIDRSLQDSIRDTFGAYSNTKAYFSNSTVVFEESLPNDMDLFESRMNRLKNFAEANESSLRININETISDMQMTVYPSDLIYTHNFTNREMMIIPKDINDVMKYKTTITVYENVTCDWAFMAGDFDYELNVISPDNAGCDHDRLVDIGQNATITILSRDEPDNRIVIYITPAWLRIVMDSSSVFSATAKNEVYHKDYPESMWLGNSLISINFTSFGLRREGGARIR